MSKSRSRRRPGVLLRSQASSAFLVCKYAVSAPRIGGPTGSPSRARCRRGRGHHESAIEYVLFPLHRSLLSADLPPRPPSPPRPATPPARRFTPPPCQTQFRSRLDRHCSGGASLVERSELQLRGPCQLCRPRSSRILHFGKGSGTCLVVFVCHQPFPVLALSPSRASVTTDRWCSTAPTPSKALSQDK